VPGQEGGKDVVALLGGRRADITIMGRTGGESVNEEDRFFVATFHGDRRHLGGDEPRKVGLLVSGGFPME
jgi:hypothetical protein